MFGLYLAEIRNTNMEHNTDSENHQHLTNNSWFKHIFIELKYINHTIIIWTIGKKDSVYLNPSRGRKTQLHDSIRRTKQNIVKVTKQGQEYYTTLLESKPEVMNYELWISMTTVSSEHRVASLLDLKPEVMNYEFPWQPALLSIPATSLATPWQPGLLSIPAASLYEWWFQTKQDNEEVLSHRIEWHGSG